MFFKTLDEYWRSWALIGFSFSSWTLDRFQLLFLEYGEVNLPKYTNAYYLLKYYPRCDILILSICLVLVLDFSLRF
ncbi:uncharacterized protein OCT59_019035 [Rhizophagus irregularis]|uniref:uncharacterized protein n=1 Tax=Rhizophagus irregularis TaxID=588596 RepID=UPI003333F50C|nr:hypothetical protein OCT59_019035 [Rhizophagus irregularis]